MRLPCNKCATFYNLCVIITALIFLCQLNTQDDSIFNRYVHPGWSVRFLADRTIGRAFGTLCRLSVVCVSVVCDVLYPGKTAGPICMKFSGKVWSDHATTCLHFVSIRETARCRDANFFVINITRKRLDRFA